MTDILDLTMNIIERQILDMQNEWPGTEVFKLKNGGSLVFVPSVRLRPKKFNAAHADIWFDVPLGYPLAPPQDFYIPTTLSMAHGGGIPNTALIDEVPYTEPVGRGPTIACQKCFMRFEQWQPQSATLYAVARAAQHWLNTVGDGYD